MSRTIPLDWPSEEAIDGALAAWYGTHWKQDSTASFIERARREMRETLLASLPQPPPAPDCTVIGKVTWHTSEPGGGPDVGVMIGLGDGKALWLGEISSVLHAQGGAAAAALGGDGGWWLAVFPDSVPLAKVVDDGGDTLRQALETLANYAARGAAAL